MTTDKGFVLTRDSHYRIKSLESRDKPLTSQGIFLGYTAIGNDEGICLELDESHGEDKGKIRIIPTHMLVSIDVISAAVEGGEQDKEKTSVYYA